jgi:predicted PurR-regulated permease PerM
MPLAADYPLLEVFWTIALVSLWAVWIFTVIWTLADNFGRHDHGGVAKAVWTVVIILFPLLGVLTYLITRPNEVPQQGPDASAGQQAPQ